MTTPLLSQNPLAPDLEHILRHTEGLWESLRGENIFVTGGTGFFGRWLLESFAYINDALDLRAKMVVLSRTPEAFLLKANHFRKHHAINLISGDVRTFTAGTVRAQLGSSARGEFSFVIHAATEASAKLNEENPLLMLDTIVQGTRGALEFARAANTKRFLLVSSGAVYGRQPPGIAHLTEDYTGAPNCTDRNAAYGEGKRIAELLCVVFHRLHNLEMLIARCFAFVGPFLPLDSRFAIGNFIRDALQGGPIRVNGDGTPYRSYLYAADLAIWLWTILLKGRSCYPYNVGSDNAYTIQQIAECVAKAFKIDEVRIRDKADPDRSSDRYVPACQRARVELGLFDRINLHDAIRRTANAAGSLQH
jgi:dTDP-glucose 4,6-dehydratase